MILRKDQRAINVEINADCCLASYEEYTLETCADDDFEERLILNERSELIHLRLRRKQNDTDPVVKKPLDAALNSTMVVDIYEGKEKADPKVKEIAYCGDYLVFRLPKDELKIQIYDLKKDTTRQFDLKEFLSDQPDKQSTITLNPCDPMNLLRQGWLYVVNQRKLNRLANNVQLTIRESTKGNPAAARPVRELIIDLNLEIPKAVSEMSRTQDLFDPNKFVDTSFILH